MTGSRFSYDIQYVNTSGLQSIHNNVSHFFNISPNAKANTRKRDIANVRHWTIFIAKCKGYSNREVAGFFQKNISVVPYVVNKKIDEIELYPKSKTIFEHFITSENLIVFYKSLLRGKLKLWLRKYYTQYVRELRVQASKNSEVVHPESISTVKTLLQHVQTNKKRIYRHLISHRERHAIDNALLIVERVFEDYKNKKNDLKKSDCKFY